MKVSLIVDLRDPDDVREAQRFLAEHGASRTTGNAAEAVQQLRDRQTLCWTMVRAVAEHLQGEFTLADIAEQMHLSQRKIKSLRAILSKPEKRTGILILQSIGGGRYRMPERVRELIMANPLEPLA